MDFYPKIRIVSLDVDGILVKSRLARFDRKYLEWISGNIPILKKTILGFGEIMERIANFKYELVDLREMTYLYESIQNADYIIITTDRSVFGINTLVKRLPSFEKMIRSHRVSRIQVRKNIILNLENSLIKDISIREYSNVKPDAMVLYSLYKLAVKNHITPREVLVADDNPQVRIIAKEEFGFQIFPDDIVTVVKAELKSNPVSL